MIRGTVQTVVYQNPENGYAVLRLNTEDGQQITVVGTVPMTVPGERLIVTGKWGYHASHGRQFEAEFLERLMPETGNEIFAYLASGAVKGIGEKTAEMAIQYFDGKKVAEIPAQVCGIDYCSVNKTALAAGGLATPTKDTVGYEVKVLEAAK